MEERFEYEVTFKACRELGIRLAPYGACERGAVFDGWRHTTDETRDSEASGEKPSAESKGEGLELLEVGDRLTCVQSGAQLKPWSSFGRICASIQEATRQSRSSADSDASAKQVTRVRLAFKKPLDVVRVVIEDEGTEEDAGEKASAASMLQVWFRPAEGSTAGARFAACAPEASEAVRAAFEGVRPGMALLSVNNRAVEGLQFNLALDAVRQTLLPLELRFCAPEPQGELELEPEAQARVEADAYGAIMGPGASFAGKHLQNFFDAILEMDKDAFVARLGDGVDLGVRDALGRTPLVCAAGLPREACFFASHLLAEGAFVNDTDDANDGTALHVAARVGNVALIELLAVNGADANARDARGHPPLFEAVAARRVEAVSVLLRAGADGRATEPGRGWNALHFAAVTGRCDVAALLLDKAKVPLHALTRPAPWRGPRSAIDIAREGGHAELAAVLHERLSAEPLQRVWPRAGQWALGPKEDGLRTPDLLWRVGRDFEDMRGPEVADRVRASNRLRNFRERRPPGRHDPEAVLSRERHVAEEEYKRKDYDEESDAGSGGDDDDGDGEAEFGQKRDEMLEAGGELWLGSAEAVAEKWAVKRHARINAVLLVHDGPGLFDADARGHRWLRKVPHMELPAPATFKAFAKELPRVARFLRDQLRGGRRVLVAATDASAADPLELPTLVATAGLMVVRGERLADARHLVRQGLYFYSRDGAIAKKEWTLRASLNVVTEAEMQRFRVLHDVKAHLDGEARTALRDEFAQGLVALEETLCARKLKQSRRQQVHFRANFVM